MTGATTSTHDRIPMMEAPSRATIVVTGAGSGIGYATTTLLLEKGYRVLAWDAVPGRLAALSHANLRFYQLDVRDKAAMDSAVAAAQGDLRGLVACAAVFKRMPFLELDETTWDTHLDVNLKGAFLACQAVLPAMRRSGGGGIVLFSSSLARTGSPTGGHYAATKGGLLGLGRSLALELARDGIRVNVISPGITDTPQPRAHGTEAEFYAKMKNIPLGRFGRAEEMAAAALYLLEDDSSFVTGQDIRINGGSQIS
jgi:NAD(P)-dependent dehydrogenase (short-subunit alcohol dehydrogenase family)